VYGYGGGYTPVTRLDPGRAYWMKVRDSGSVILSASVAGSPPSAAAVFAPADWGTLSISDAGGAAQTLYFGRASEGHSAGRFEMPPPPPGEAFDARFAGGMIAALATQGTEASFPVLLSGARPPLTISWRNRSATVQAFLHTGPGRTPLDGEGSLTLPSAGVTLSVSLSAHHTAPTAYALHQNYPNPFNSTTTFQFTIVDRQPTTVRVFDLLGREVATLVHDVKEPGTHSIRWDAGGASSGVYFCRMQAGPFTATRKLLLLR